MKVNKLTTYWIIIKSLWATIWTSSAILFLSLINRCNREKVNSLIYFWAVKILQIVKVRYEFFNPYNVILEPNKPYVIMSNHCSHYDIPLIYVAFPARVRMISKKELSKVPIWGHAMRKSEIIMLDREKGREAMRNLNVAKEKILSGIVPWIATEGTRSRTGELGPFKKGGFWLAMQTNATIIPVAIIGSGKILPPKTMNFSLNEHVEIHICQPIVTSDYKDVKEIMVETEHRIREVIKSKRTDL